MLLKARALGAAIRDGVRLHCDQELVRQQNTYIYIYMETQMNIMEHGDSGPEKALDLTHSHN